MMERVDTVVIGAGAVGLACARALAQAGHEVLILERGPRFGGGVSSRNSEVIHAGLYYSPGSLKARLCVRGKDLLYAYCAQRGLPHRRTGKLVVAEHETQVTALQAMQARARTCGVEDLHLLDAATLHSLEPALQGAAALLSPSTGIVDSHALMLSLLGDAEHAGATLVLETPVVEMTVQEDGLMVSTGGAMPTRLLARRVVNAAGLAAPALATRTHGLGPAHVPRAHYAKGSYFSLSGRAPFRHLVYPLPEAAGLGVHLTLDLQGRARFGPDVEWLDDDVGTSEGEPPASAYAVDTRPLPAFEAAIRRYWPALPEGALSPDYAGIRPKIHRAGEAQPDFRIDDATTHGVAGLVNLFGIESPGLTASLAIGEHVAERLSRR